MREVPQKKLSVFNRAGFALDSFIGFFSPERGIRRQVARTKAMAFSSYRGTLTDRLRSAFSFGSGSPDADLLPNLEALRSKSRDLERNNPYARGALETHVTNCIGTGLTPQSNIDWETLGISQEDARTIGKLMDNAWERWSRYADTGGRMHIDEIQRLTFHQLLLNGESLSQFPMVRKAEDPLRPYELSIEVIEADRLETPRQFLSDKNVRDGVRLGDRGQAIQYYIRKDHPGDQIRPGARVYEYLSPTAYNEFGRPNVIHLYWVRRPGQTRGEPFFAPVIDTFLQLARLQDSRITRAQVASMFALVIEQENPLSALDELETDSKGKAIEELQSGTIQRIGKGEKVTPVNPQLSNLGDDAFVREIFGAVASGLSLSPQLLLRDLQGLNYSSARTMLLEARRLWICWQWWFSQHYLQPIWEMLIEEMWLNDELPKNVSLVGPARHAWLRCKWQPMGWAWVDPQTEVDAALRAVEGGISTLEIEAAARGENWEELLEQQSRERAKRQELGLPDPAPSAPGPGRPAQEDGTTQPKKKKQENDNGDE